MSTARHPSARWTGAPGSGTGQRGLSPHSLPLNVATTNRPWLLLWRRPGPSIWAINLGHRSCACSLVVLRSVPWQALGEECTAETPILRYVLMILSQQDLDEFGSEYSSFQSCYGTGDAHEYEARQRFLGWLTDNPQVMVAGAFHEYVAAHASPIFRRLLLQDPNAFDDGPRPLFRRYQGQWLLLSHVPRQLDEPCDGYSLQAFAHKQIVDRAVVEAHRLDASWRDTDIRAQELVRKLPRLRPETKLHLARLPLLRRTTELAARQTRHAQMKCYVRGASWSDALTEAVLQDVTIPAETKSLVEKVWALRKACLDLPPGALLAQECAEHDSIVQLPSVDEILRKARLLVDNPLVDPIAFVSPHIWTPMYQWAQKDALQSSAVHIIKELQMGERDLQSVDWRTFEDLVAEVLRAQGMEIHLVRESPQGGRDIIARGELAGTEVVTIAVEVKHKAVVSRPEVDAALYQNSNFPALMFVTSGRFTAGVIRLARKPENRMRLLLKDGVAIRELLRSYSFCRQ